jgi:hypothetical protein
VTDGGEKQRAFKINLERIKGADQDGKPKVVGFII